MKQVEVILLELNVKFSDAPFRVRPPIRYSRASAVAPRSGVRALSPRELECLSWVALGKTDEDIAPILGRSRDTVHFRLNNPLRKLNAANRTNAVAIACSLGIVRLF